MLIYQGIVTAILAALLLNTINNLRLLRRPPVLPAPADGPLVSVLIPARNEARTIARCVESLARQDYPRCEILVLDDHSEDQTAAIVADLARRCPRVRLLRGRPLPSGWHGKAFACSQLARAATGEWLLFVDAETIHSPHSVSTALRVARQRNAGLLTMIPRLETGSLAEALLLPTVPLTFAAVLPLGLVMKSSSPLISGAFGPFLLFRRDTYERLGGHAAVRADIVEDMQLSRLVKRHGGRVIWIDGAELVRVRLYHGLNEAWHGLAKSAFAAIDYSLLGLLVGVPLCVTALLAPYGFLLVGLLCRQQGAALLWLPLCQIALIWTAYLLLLWRFRLPLGMVALQGATIAAIIFYTIYSAYQVWLGAGVVWKGRSYQFATRPRRLRSTRSASASDRTTRPRAPADRAGAPAPRSDDPRADRSPSRPAPPAPVAPRTAPSPGPAAPARRPRRAG